MTGWKYSGNGQNADLQLENKIGVYVNFPSFAKNGKQCAFMQVCRAEADGRTRLLFVNEFEADNMPDACEGAVRRLFAHAQKEEAFWKETQTRLEVML